MKLEQAARQALEALVVAEEFVDRHSEDWYISGQQDLKQIRESITALQEALASRCQTTTTEQSEQSQLADATLEPVAWLVQYKDCHTFVWGRKPEFIVDGVVEPLYAAPVRTKDLTDDELASACGWKLGDPMYEWVVDIGRWAIAADREKNK